MASHRRVGDGILYAQGIQIGGDLFLVIISADAGDDQPRASIHGFC